MIILAAVLAPIMEEMGYGVDSLRAKTGMMKATLLFGTLLSVWHAPLFLIGGTYQNQLAGMDNPLFLANFFVSIIPATIIASAAECRTGREVHCNASVRGDCAPYRDRSRALRGRSPRFFALGAALGVAAACQSAGCANGRLDGRAYGRRYACKCHNGRGFRPWKRRKFSLLAAALAACLPPRNWRGAAATNSISS
jgi:hypothetical protein